MYVRGRGVWQGEEGGQLGPPARHGAPRGGRRSKRASERAGGGIAIHAQTQPSARRAAAAAAEEEGRAGGWGRDEKPLPLPEFHKPTETQLVGDVEGPQVLPRARRAAVALEQRAQRHQPLGDGGGEAPLAADVRHQQAVERRRRLVGPVFLLVWFEIFDFFGGKRVGVSGSDVGRGEGAAACGREKERGGRGKGRARGGAGQETAVGRSRAGCRAVARAGGSGPAAVSPCPRSRAAPA